MGQCCVRKNMELKSERNLLMEEKNIRNKNIIIIKNFILKNIKTIKIKKNYEKRLSLLESLFCNQISDQNFNEQNHYKERFAFKLNELIEQKHSIFKDLFPEDITLKLNSFEYLKNKLGNYYNDDIYENKMNFYKDFVISLQENEKEKKQYIKKPLRKSLNSYFLNFISNNSKECDTSQISSGFSALNFGNINLNIEEKYIKKDIDILYKYCFNIEKLPNFDICKKKCRLLSLIYDIQNKDIKINISDDFKNFLKTLYHIILLKKCNCLSYTGDNIFYSINKKLMIFYSESNVNDIISNDIKKKEDKTNSNIKTKKSTILFQKKSRNNLNSLSNKTGFINTINTDYSTNNDNNNTNINNNDLDVFQIKNIHSTSTRVLNSKKLKTVIEREPFLFIKNIKSLNSHKKLKKFQNIDEEYYSGQYDNTTYLYAGYGTLIQPEKNMCYTGTFKYGLKDGMGIQYEESNKNNIFIYYIGEFKNNIINGYGEKIIIKNNTFYYREGLFNDKIFLHGKVKIIKDSINKGEIEVINYEGDMSNDLFNGYGFLIQKTYTINEYKKYDFLYEKEYKGQFKNGKENGKGKIKYNNGINNESYQYTGNFVDGLRDGFGIITYPDNYFIQKYEGFFKEDKPFCTYGIVYFKSGDRYEGFFNSDYQKTYIGDYSFYDPVSKKINENYFGGFINDAKHGMGKIYLEKSDSSKILIGNFNIGDKHGHFEMNEYKNELMKIKSNNRRRRLTSWNFGEIYEKKLQKNQKKIYILFEKNEIMEKSEFPIDD